MDLPRPPHRGPDRAEVTDSALEILVLKASLKAERQRSLEYQGERDELAVLRQLCAEQRDRIAQMEAADAEELHSLRELAREQRQRIQQLEAEKNDWLARAEKLVPLFRDAAALFTEAERDARGRQPILRLAS